MPVQGVYKFAKPTNQRRIIAGTVLSGRIRAGDEVVFHPSGKKSRVRTLEAFNRPAPMEASADEAVGFTLTDELYLGRGEIATLAGQPAPQVGSRLKVSLFWLGRNPLTTRKEYVLKLGTAKVRFRVEQIHRVIDGADSSASDTASEVGRNEVAECTLVLNTPLAFDLIDECPPTGRFVIVDDFDISGGGIILEALPELYASLSRETRALPEPAVLWFTGLSGAGKSTIAQQVVQRLLAAGARVECLDGDVVRTAFPQTGFTRPERDEHIRRVGFLASRLEHHGVFVVCALISPYEASRSYVRGLCRRFVEIHVSTPLAECERRDVKGLYERARRGEIAHFTGLDDAYEEPRAPELRIDTSDMTVTDAADAVLATLYRTDQACAKMRGQNRELPRSIGAPERSHPARGLCRVSEPVHAVVDWQGQHGPPVADAQGVLRARAVSADSHRHVVQDPGDDRLSRSAGGRMGSQPHLRAECRGAARTGARSRTARLTALTCCSLLKTEALKRTLSGEWPRYRFNHTTLSVRDGSEYRSRTPV